MKTFVLRDAIDQLGAVATLPGALSVESAPVDARAVPASLPGLRTVFNAIHHFPPAQVAEVLRSATDGGRSIAIFEPFERRPRLALRLAAGALGGGWRDARRYRGPFLRAAAAPRRTRAAVATNPA